MTFPYSRDGAAFAQVRTIAAFARFTLLEAVRSRLGLVALALICAGLVLGQFLDEIALTEARAIRSAVLASLYRLGAVFLSASFVITSLVREHNDKGLELWLSLPVPRASYLLGKWLGFVWAGMLLGAMFGLPLLLTAPPGGVAAWTLSLMLELSLVASVSLLCVLTFNHVVSGLAAVAAFYALSRVMAALLTISASPVAPHGSAGFEAASWTLNGIAALLPRLDQFTRTAWLLGNGVDSSTLSALTAQAAAYCALATGAALIDLQRKNV